MALARRLKRGLNGRAIVSLIVIASTMTFALIWTASAAVGRWESLGPEGGSVNALVFSPDYANDKNIFAKTESGVFRSSNAGNSWARMVIGPDEQSVKKVALSPDYSIDQTIFALTAKGVFRSSDAGGNWRFIKKIKQTDGDEIIAVSPNYAKDMTVFVGHSQGDRFKVFKSIDQGLNWKPVKVGRLAWAPVNFLFSPNYAKDKTMLAGMREDGVYRSTDSGQSWRRIAPDSIFADIMVLAFSPNYAKDKAVFFGAGGGGDIDNLSVSQDGGRSWHKRIAGIARSLAFSPGYRHDKTAFAAANDGLYKSTNAGKTWNKIKPSPEFTYIMSMTISPDYRRDKTIYLVRENAFKPGQKLIRSTNGGRTWREVGLTLRRGSPINAVVPSPSYLSDQTLFATTNAGIYKSTDKGKTWIKSNGGLKAMSMNMVVPSPNFAADKTIFGSSEFGVYKTVDRGVSWKHIRKRLENYPAAPAVVLSPNYAVDQVVFIVDITGIHKSTDGGATWTKPKMRAKVTVATDYTPLAVSPNFSVDHTVLAIGENRILKSTDGGANWREIKITFRNYAIYPYALAFSPAYGVDKTVFAVDSTRVFKSTDRGAHWRRLPGIKGFESDHVRAHIVLSPDYARDKTLLVEVSGISYYRSNNGGKTWNRVNGIYDLVAFSPHFAVDRTIFTSPISPFSAGIKRSIDNGLSWQPVGGVSDDILIIQIAPSPAYANDKTIFAGTRGAGVISYAFAD